MILINIIMITRKFCLQCLNFFPTKKQEQLIYQYKESKKEVHYNHRTVVYRSDILLFI